MDAPFRALVLAGQRGETDALAQAGGASHRAMLPVAGVPMLLRVVRALRACPAVGTICISIDDPEPLSDAPELAAGLADGSLAVHRSRGSPAGSVADALEDIPPGERLLVVTADHALLTPAMVEHFARTARESGADVVVGVVGASRIRERYPDAVRTYLPLRDDRYSGANLFAFQSADAGRAAEFWTRAERLRKRPWRLVSVFGPWTLLLFALRRLDLAAAMGRVSRAMGVRVAAVSLPFAEAAIDVDRESDRVLAERILAQRETPP